MWVLVGQRTLSRTWMTPFLVTTFARITFALLKCTVPFLIVTTIGVPSSDCKTWPSRRPLVYCALSMVWWSKTSFNASSEPVLWGLPALPKASFEGERQVRPGWPSHSSVEFVRFTDVSMDERPMADKVLVQRAGRVRNLGNVSIVTKPEKFKR